MKTSTKGLFALMNHEGVALASYKDSVGVWTVGCGHTKHAGHPIPAPGLRITLERAVQLFRRDVKKYETAVDRSITVPVQQHEFDALVSFHYNTGAIAKASFVKKLNAGDRAGAAAGMMAWKKPPEIIGRRKKEQHLFRTGDYGDLSTVLVYTGVTKSGSPTGAKRYSTSEVMGVSKGEPERPAVVPPARPANLFDIMAGWFRAIFGRKSI